MPLQNPRLPNARPPSREAQVFGYDTSLQNSETLNLRRTPHPVIVTIRNSKDYIRVRIPIIPLLQGGGGPPNLNPTTLEESVSWDLPLLQVPAGSL